MKELTRQQLVAALLAHRAAADDYTGEYGLADPAFWTRLANLETELFNRGFQLRKAPRS